MHNYVVVEVPSELLPQVVRELLQFATDPNLVDVVHGESGRVIHAHPKVADAWYLSRKKAEEKAPKVSTAEAPKIDEAPLVPSTAKREAAVSQAFTSVRSAMKSVTTPKTDEALTSTSTTDRREMPVTPVSPTAVPVKPAPPKKTTSA